MYKLACLLFLVSSSFFLQLQAQSKAKYTYKVERIVSDTLAYLQGEWDFDHLRIEGKRGSRTGYYATGLKIENSTFFMGLSEATASGTIVFENGKVFFKCSPSGNGEPGRVFELLTLKKRKLEFVHRSQSYNYIFPKYAPPYDVVYSYERAWPKDGQ